MIENILRELLQQRRVLIVCHRAFACGDLMENTAAGIRAAWMSGAEIAEFDVARSRDGVYYCIHDGMEMRLIEGAPKITELTSRDIDRLEYFNMSRSPAGKVERLESVLEAVGGNCRGLLNLDRSPRYWESGLLELLAKYDLYDRLILKSAATSVSAMDALERSELPFAFMPILTAPEQWEPIRRRRLRTVGAEILFQDESSGFLSAEFRREFHDRGLFLWGNAIRIGTEFNFSGFHDDRGALTEGPDRHWGWLIDHGINVIQTDCPTQLYCYLAARYPGSRPPLYAPGEACPAP